jgi:hypothetical protein
MDKVLVDGGQLVLELRLQMLDDLGVAFHAASGNAPRSGAKNTILTRTSSGASLRH